MRVRVVGEVDERRLKRRPQVPERSAAVGARVESLRLAKGWTTRELARQTGLSENMLSHLQRRDKPALLNAYSLAAIAEAFGVSLDWLWYGEREARAS